MAYNKAFNPDALPAHAEPEQAAQALSALQVNRRPSPNVRPPGQPPLHPPSNTSPPTLGGRRPSPAGIAAQQAYRPTPQQQQQQQQPQSHQPQYNHNQYSNNNQYSRLQSPPPPADYGAGPRPTPQQSQGYGPGRQPVAPPNQYPRRTPAPPDPDSADLYPLFRAANTSGTGSLTETELGSALVNADFTPFDILTIKSLMRMFSTSPPYQPQGPTITYSEFQNLWRFLAAWRQLFERFDEDASGRISLGEFSKALVAFGYRLSQPFVGVLYNTFNDRGQDVRGTRGQSPGGMSFDLFVQACISLKRMTDVFKGYDDDRDGYVTLSFEEFLTEILRLRE